MATCHKNKGDNVVFHLATQNIKIQVTQVPIPVLPMSGPTRSKTSLYFHCFYIKMNEQVTGLLGKNGSSEWEVTCAKMPKKSYVL